VAFLDVSAVEEFAGVDAVFPVADAVGEAVVADPEGAGVADGDGLVVAGLAVGGVFAVVGCVIPPLRGVVTTGGG
jgi:hypothetical protein